MVQRARQRPGDRHPASGGSRARDPDPRRERGARAGGLPAAQPARDGPAREEAREDPAGAGRARPRAQAEVRQPPQARRAQRRRRHQATRRGQDAQAGRRAAHRLRGGARLLRVHARARAHPARGAAQPGLQVQDLRAGGRADGLCPRAQPVGERRRHRGGRRGPRAPGHRHDPAGRRDDGQGQHPRDEAQEDPGGPALPRDRRRLPWPHLRGARGLRRGDGGLWQLAVESEPAPLQGGHQPARSDHRDAPGHVVQRRDPRGGSGGRSLRPAPVGVHGRRRHGGLHDRRRGGEAHRGRDRPRQLQVGHRPRRSGRGADRGARAAGRLRAGARPRGRSPRVLPEGRAALGRRTSRSGGAPRRERRPSGTGRPRRPPRSHGRGWRWRKARRARPAGGGRPATKQKSKGDAE